jgi:hypothetical protein
LFVILILATTFLFESFSATNAASTSSSSGSLNIEVDHTVEIRNGGLIVIKDTVGLKAKTGEEAESLQSFLLGFPFIYRSNLIYVDAHDMLNQKLDVELDVGLGKPGFYAVEVKSFPQPVNISEEEPYEFMVTFVFSDLVRFEKPEFNATFPAVPSLDVSASRVNLTIVLPSTVNASSSSFQSDNIGLTNRKVGVYNYTWKDVEPFAYKPSWLKFKETNKGNFLLLEAVEAKRIIEIENLKRVLLTDSYIMVSKAEDLSELTVQVAPSAYEITAWDVLERKYGEEGEGETLTVERGKATEPVNVTLPFQFKKNEQVRFRLTYFIPWENVVNQTGWQHYQVNLPSLGDFAWIIRKLVITVILPEGGEFISLKGTEASESGILQREAFQESLTFTYYNVTSFHKLASKVAYDYNVLWFSFRPTLWVGAAVTAIAALVLIWRAQKPAAPIPKILIKPEELKKYVSAYEEKRRNLRLLETLEEKARRGKIPRRRYKVRKRALESRLSVLSKDLTRLRETLRSASSKYADMMRQIEVAEAELESIEMGIRRTETRYRRGEISTAAYHKLLEDYFRRRERARTTIDGIILRLKEEIA